MRVLTGSVSTYVFTFTASDLRFLALRRAPGLLHEGTWQAVHGMIEDGEAAHAAAQREVIEETGLQPERFFVTDYVERFYSVHTDAVHLVPAFAAFVPDAPAATVSEEHTAYEWLSLADVTGRFVFRSQREAVQLIAECVTNWPVVAAMNELTNSAARR